MSISADDKIVKEALTGMVAVVGKVKSQALEFKPMDISKVDNTVQIDEPAFNWQVQDRKWAFLFATLKQQSYLPILSLTAPVTSMLTGGLADADPFAAAMKEATAASLAQASAAVDELSSLEARSAARGSFVSADLVTPWDMVSNGHDDPNWLLSSGKISEAMIRRALIQAMLLEHEAKNPIVLYNILSSISATASAAGSAIEKARGIRVWSANSVTGSAARKAEDELSAFRSSFALAMPTAKVAAGATRTTDHTKTNKPPTTKGGSSPGTYAAGEFLDETKDFESKLVAGLVRVDDEVRDLRAKAASIAMDDTKPQTKKEAAEAAEALVKEAVRVQTKYWEAYAAKCQEFLKDRGALDMIQNYFLAKLDPKVAQSLTEDQKAIKARRLNTLLHAKPYEFDRFVKRLALSLEDYRQHTVPLMQRRLCTPSAKLQFQLFSLPAGKVDFERNPESLAVALRSVFGNYLHIENIQLLRLSVPPKSAGDDAVPISYTVCLRVGARDASRMMESIDADIIAFESLFASDDAGRPTSKRPKAAGWLFLSRYEQQPTNKTPVKCLRFIGRQDAAYDMVQTANQKRFCVPRTFNHLPAYKTRIDLYKAEISGKASAEPSVTSSGKVLDKDPSHDIFLIQQQIKQKQDEKATWSARFVDALRSMSESGKDTAALIKKFNEENDRLAIEIKKLTDKMISQVDPSYNTVVAVGNSDEVAAMKQLQLTDDSARGSKLRHSAASPNVAIVTPNSMEFSASSSGPRRRPVRSAVII
jgi:hypothetical protein